MNDWCVGATSGKRRKPSESQNRRPTLVPLEVDYDLTVVTKSITESVERVTGYSVLLSLKIFIHKNFAKTRTLSFSCFYQELLGTEGHEYGNTWVHPGNIGYLTSSSLTD